METIRKIFEAIGKVTTMLMAMAVGIVAAIGIARFPLWLVGIIVVCVFVVLVNYQMEE